MKLIAFQAWASGWCMSFAFVIAYEGCVGCAALPFALGIANGFCATLGVMRAGRKAA